MKFSHGVVLLHTGPLAPGRVRGPLLIYPSASAGAAGFMGLLCGLGTGPQIGGDNRAFVGVKKWNRPFFF